MPHGSCIAKCVLTRLGLSAKRMKFQGKLIRLRRPTLPSSVSEYGSSASTSAPTRLHKPPAPRAPKETNHVA